METNKCKATTKARRQSDYFTAVLSRAERTVEQWDNHDQYRQTEADKSLNDPQLGEPDDVAIARTVLQLNDAMELAEKDAETERLLARTAIEEVLSFWL
jgi:hypothetical protein